MKKNLLLIFLIFLIFFCLVGGQSQCLKNLEKIPPDEQSRSPLLFWFHTLFKNRISCFM